MKKQGCSADNAQGLPRAPFHSLSSTDFQVWQCWQWDGQSVESIRDQRAMLSKWPSKISEWADTVPDDFRAPITSAGQEMARILACDTRGQALLRLLDCRGHVYSVLPIEDARKFILKIRKFFNVGKDVSHIKKCRRQFATKYGGKS